MTIDVLVNPASVVRPLKPIWYATVQLSIPLGDRDTGDLEMAMAMVLIFRLQIRLYEVFNRDSRRGRRSIQEDQLELFRQIEDNIATMGVDGHACVLRFICEMQTNRFSRSSIFGEIFTLIFTPKQGDDYSLLKDYIAAEMAGQEADIPSGSGPTCVERYASCPMSVFAALRRFQSGLGYSTPADRPGNATIHTDDHILALDDEV